MNNYVSLHNHSDYSFLDSVAKIDDLTKKAKSLNMPGLAITEHGNICSWLKFYESCKNQSLKPIFGCEFYVADDATLPSRIDTKIEEIEQREATSMGALFEWAEHQDEYEQQRKLESIEDALTEDHFDMKAQIEYLKDYKNKVKKSNHLILLAKNRQGYDNIIKLSSYGYQNGLFYKPRIDMKVLEQYKDGIIVLSACLGGQISNSLLKGNFEKAEKYVQEYKRIFGEDFYLELQLHEIEEQKTANRGLIELMKKYKVQPVITQDVHYVEKEDIELHEIVVKLRKGERDEETEDKVPQVTTPEILKEVLPKTEDDGDSDGYFYTARGLYFKSYDELVESWKAEHDYIHEKIFNKAIDNTMVIFNKIETFNVRSDKPLLPVYDTNGLTPRQFILELIKKGAKEKLGKKIEENPSLKAVYEARMKEELDTICELNFEQYFLIVWDIMNWCKEHDILTGPGRGCLTPNSKIVIDNFLKNIEDVNIGDFVISDDGKRNRVVNKFKYKVLEDIIKINHQFSDYYDSPGYTSDHKILIVKNKRTNYNNPGNKKFIIPLNNINKNMPKNIFISKNNYLNNITPEYVESKNIEHGDFLCIPITKYEEKNIEYFDLNSKMNSNEKFIKEITSNNYKNKLSTGSIAKKLGISKCTVSRIVHNVIKNSKYQEKLLKIVNDNEFETIEKYKLFVSANKYKENIISRYIACDEIFLNILGMYISDGWSTKNGIAFGFHSSKNKKQRKILREFCERYGFMYNNIKHKKKNLIQTYIYSQSIKSLFDRLVKKYAINKNIDVSIKSLPKEKLKYLIKGLMFGDGHVKRNYNDKNCYDSINESLILDIKEILISLGIPSGIKKRFADGKKITHDSYKLSIATNDLFGKTTMYNYLSDEKYIYIPVNGVIREKYDGYVYDLQIDKNPSFRTNQYVVHNSAAGSLIAFLLGITHLDPIEHDLLFSRFINKSRSGAKYKLEFDDIPVGAK